MLTWWLLAAAILRFWPRTGTQPLCGTHLVRTEKIVHVPQHVEGDQLYFSSSVPQLIKHPCEENIALYLGTEVFFTKDGFESSLLPFSIPSLFMVATPEVSSAIFSGSIMVIVVNKMVYLYDYEKDFWDISQGIEQPVTHVSGESCCYDQGSTCLDISYSVYAYARGADITDTNIYWSNSQGYRFQNVNSVLQLEEFGTLGGIFKFHSLSQIGILWVIRTEAVFTYSYPPLNYTLNEPFDYPCTFEVILVPGQRGILILWCENGMLISQNSGQLISPAWVMDGPENFYSIFDISNISIHNVAANENEVAVLTRDHTLYYGSLGIQSNSLVKFPGKDIWSQQSVLMFTGAGSLDILTPLADPKFPAFDFQKCSVNINRLLMNSTLNNSVCDVELLQGEFDKGVFTIDMNSQLELSVLMIPRPGRIPVPLAMVSNPHSLGLDDVIYEDGYTLDWATKYRLNISLRQQHHWGRADVNFTSSIKKSTLSTITVDIANRQISCVDIKPLSALISIGCDLEKKIVIQNTVSACSRGILNLETLQNNYTYVIEKEAYDSKFGYTKSKQDLVVHYHYGELGCPLLVYYDTLWKPVVELWRGETFQEVVEAEYVLIEVNGLFTYKYTLTAGTAGCTSQPQNWSNIQEDASISGFFVWDRESYKSCHSPENKKPLRWPNVPYQVLGGRTNNKIAFDQRNGIYVFFLSIVDPLYSYCQLDTIFSVYVHGAYPLRTIVFELGVSLIMLTLLLMVVLAYLLPKMMKTKTGNRVREAYTQLCNRLNKIFWCFRWRRRRRWRP